MSWWNRGLKLAPKVVDALGELVERGGDLMHLRTELAKRATAGDLDDVIRGALTRAQRVRLWQRTGLHVK